MGKKEDIKDFGLGCLSMVLGLWVILYIVDWLLTVLLGAL
jgi:preprotein translocase subunit SecE